MKIIHTADLHLGASYSSNFDGADASRLGYAQNSAFKMLVDYASENGISVIMLSGDVFDSDAPDEESKRSFTDTVKSHPAIDFLYLRGNHDKSNTYSDLYPKNLKTFGSAWSSYTYGNIKIHGIELNEKKESLAAGLEVDGEKVNIVMLHADVKSEIKLSELAGMGLSYIALGHIHSYEEYKVDEKCSAVYCGCLQGRGFDECGEKGFCEITTDEGIVKHKFIPFAERTFCKEKIDISDFEGAEDVIARAKRIPPDKNKGVEILITGEASFDTDSLPTYIEDAVKKRFLAVKVKNKSKVKTALDEYLSSPTLKGEFVRILTEKADPEILNEAARIGIDLLNGGKL